MTATDGHHTPTPLDVLFVSMQPLWPPDQGYRIRGSHMVRHLTQSGLNVGAATMLPEASDAPAWLRALSHHWPRPGPEDDATLRRSWNGPWRRLRQRLSDYLGFDAPQLAGAITLVRELRPRCVIGLGQLAPMLLRGLGGLPAEARPDTIWYAADELVWFHLSCLRRDPPATWPARLRLLAVHGAMELAFARRLDGAIGVTPAEARRLRWIAGARRTTCIRNGVDLDRFAPDQTPVTPRSLVFWGRMDFEPNIDAVQWFAETVWPELRERNPDAVWRIVGKNPVAGVRALARQPGIEVTGEVADIRPLALGSAVTVLPMRCGAGIKNKLLEAAAMSRPIALSPRAVSGLGFDRFELPFCVCRRREEWIETIRRLWHDPAMAQRYGEAARRWVESRHTWQGAARKLVGWLGLPAGRTGYASGQRGPLRHGAEAEEARGSGSGIDAQSQREAG